MINQCRFCDNALEYTFVDLGISPLSNSYLKSEQLNHMEPFYPLRVYVCEQCFLVQLPVFQSSENIFCDYAYFSSFSDSWLQHAKTYTDLMINRFGFGTESQVIEIASNDGYLLQYFKEKNIPKSPAMTVIYFNILKKKTSRCWELNQRKMWLKQLKNPESEHLRSFLDAKLQGN
jgi:hypothetical protein